MGYLTLNSSSPLFCQDANCCEQFPSRPALVPKRGKPGGAFAGRAFIVVSPHFIFGVYGWGRIDPVRQCPREDVHSDKRAWFGVWLAGVVPSRPVPASSPAIDSIRESAAPRKAKQRCGKHSCKGFTAMGCPYRYCASHCRQAGGCPKHKLPPSQSFLPISRDSQSAPVTQQVSRVDQYQDTTISEEEALLAAIQASRAEGQSTPTLSASQAFSSSSGASVPTAASSSSAASTSREPAAPRRPKISTQLGGAWLEIIDGDAADELEKEKRSLAKAEAASEAKKSVDVMWYDQVRSSYLSGPQPRTHAAAKPRTRPP